MGRWCAERDVARGAILSLERCWELGRHWYEGRAHMDWSPRSPSESEAIFRRVGLTGPFWRLV